MHFSVRMRAAQGGAHENGGRHISGAERLIPPELLLDTTQAMVQRALEHSRGNADFIRLTIEAVPPAACLSIPLLPWQAQESASVTNSRRLALQALCQAGVNEEAAAKGLLALSELPDSLRGAMILSAATGERLDTTASRGVRVSRMDLDAQSDALSWLCQQGLDGEHPREAMVLAAKVAAAPGMVAEICWSDDPEYTTGYVASPRHGYIRIPCLKEKNSANGGRAFFISPDADLAALQHFLEEQPVLVQNRPQKGQAS
ncbi:6-carboxyhexanoate--CoA ligase [Anaeromusa acidaminophila]|uniref:6-carboxyhexanoate--CoA ligase n=1 Tax=Anaeromusa acidaminophila TaxID=81464 RepID=UPI0003707BCF|nr:6-carboxyhexanoate--CoA ligase [Anaeromusa acidaminophila]